VVVTQAGNDPFESPDVRTTSGDLPNAVRVVAALEQLPHDKIDSVARHVGWRSTTNLVRAVHRATG
jgi:hypothetical protein